MDDSGFRTCPIVPHLKEHDINPSARVPDLHVPFRLSIEPEISPYVQDLLLQQGVGNLLIMVTTPEVRRKPDVSERNPQWKRTMRGLQWNSGGVGVRSHDRREVL